MVLVTFNYILGMRLNVTNINSILTILTKLLVIFYHKKFFSLNHILCIDILRYLYGTLKSVHFPQGPQLSNCLYLCKPYPIYISHASECPTRLNEF